MKDSRPASSSDRASQAAPGSGPAAAPGYLRRIELALQRALRSDSIHPGPAFVLLPPGAELLAMLCSRVSTQRGKAQLVDCRVEDPGRVLEEGGLGDGAGLVLTHLEDTDDSRQQAALALTESMPVGSCLVVAQWPFWLAHRKPAAGRHRLLDPRVFQYREEEVRCLLEGAGGDGTTLAPTDAAADVLRVSAGWPALTEQLVEATSRDLAAAIGKDPVPRRHAMLPAFRGHWLPVLERRCPWLLKSGALPSMNLDLLVHLFGDVALSVQQCLAMGILAPCPRNVGCYRVDEVLDGLLQVAGDSRDPAVTRRAAQWYERRGQLSEAIECLVTIGAKQETLAVLHERGAGTAAAAGPATPLGELGPAAGIARAALGHESAARQLPPALRKSLNKAQQPRQGKHGEAAGVVGAAGGAKTLPAGVEHIVRAYQHHREKDAAAVDSAIAAAVDSGVDREQLSTLIDFVDLHIRPLLRDSDHPLRFALKGVRHSAPARKAVEAHYQSLNHRELQVLQRICEGYKNSEISEQLGLEISTIKWYSTRIYEKLQVRNRTQAVAKAQALALFGGPR